MVNITKMPNIETISRVGVRKRLAPKPQGIINRLGRWGYASIIGAFLRIAPPIILSTTIGTAVATKGCSSKREKAPRKKDEVKKWSNRKFVLAAVRKNGMTLQHADPVLKNDREIVLAAARENGLALQYADFSLREDRNIVLTAIREDGRALYFANSSFRKDRNIVLAAVKQNGQALQFAHPFLKNNRRFTLSAVRQNGLALQFADPLFKKDRKIVLAAVTNDGRALQFAASVFKKDKKIVLSTSKREILVALCPGTTLNINGVSHLNLQFMPHWEALRYADTILKKDKRFILKTVKRTGLALQYAVPSLKKDREIVMAAVRQNGWALKYADPSLKKDRGIVMAAIRQNEWALQHADPSLKKDRKIMLAAVKQNGLVLACMDSTFKKDREIVLAAVRQNGWAFQCADPTLKIDLDFQKRVFEENFNSYHAMINPPKTLKEKYNNIINELSALNITFPQRFDTVSVIEIIKNRKNLKPDDRPIALLIYPKSDWNKAFNNNQIRALIRTYKVIYFEVKEDTEFYNLIKTRGKEKKISLLVIAGHGTESSIAFWEASKSYDEKFYLDLSDKSEMKDLAQYLEKGSTISLESCSTGRGGKRSTNVANMLRKIFYQSRVIAPRKATRVIKYIIGVTGVIYK